MTPLLARPRPAGPVEPWNARGALRTDVAPPPDPGAIALVVSLRRAAHVAACAVVATGLLVLLGWAADLEALKRLLPGDGPIKPNTALAFVLSGGALWLLAHGDMRPRLRIAAAIAVTVIGVLTLSEYFGVDLGLDQLLFWSWTAVGEADAGGMSPNAALAFLLAGGSLALGRVRLGRWWAADVLGFAAGAIGLVALVGHAAAAPAYYRIGGLAEMGVPTAICFVLLGGGILLSVPKRGASRLLVSEGPGGALARWLLPAALLTPLLLGLLRWQGQVAGLWETEAGVLLLLLSCMTAMAVVIWLYARSLDRADADRRTAEAAARHLAALVHSSDDAIVGADLDATVLSWNRGAERLSGWTAEEIVGRPAFLLLAPDRRHGDELELLDRIRRGEPIESVETVCVRKDGRPVEVELTISPVRDAAGAIAGASVIARGMSDRRRAEEAERLQAEIARNIAEGVCVVRAADRKMLWANPKFEEMFGRADGPMLGEAESTEKVVGLLKREGLAEYDVRTARGDGSEMWCQVRISVFDHPLHGRVWLAVHDDVTDARRLERERAEALAELERSNAELEQYAYVASHDLGEPLRVVSGFVQLLERRFAGELDADAHRFIAATVNGVDRMQAIIDALLAYSRVGRAEVERVRVDCTAVARQALAALQAQIHETGVEIRVGELPIVRGDEVLLGQVVQNLVSNAVKFANRDHPVVEISAEWGWGEWVFSIADNGAGIDPRHAERIFEMFQRAHGRDTPGIGIGLTICKRIVQKHGGRIWVESRAAGGTVMRFSVPDTPAAG